MIKFSINGGHQRREAEGLAERVDHVMVRATFVQFPDDQAGEFEHELLDEIEYARRDGDRGRCNALHSIRRHFNAARGIL